VLLGGKPNIRHATAYHTLEFAPRFRPDPSFAPIATLGGFAVTRTL